MHRSYLTGYCFLGLFRHVIAESGSMLTEWALDRKGGQTGYRIAELAGCKMEPYEDLLYCLRNMDEVALHEAQRAFSVSKSIQFYTFQCY